MGRRVFWLVLALAFAGFWGSRIDGDTLRIGHWEQTTYYRHTFQAEEAGSGTLEITAVDQYTLYFNGKLVKTDADWKNAEEIPVTLQQGNNHIAVKVFNSGKEEGTGLLLSLQAGSLVARSTFTDETAPWYWSEAVPEGTGWTTQDVQGKWNSVQAGAIDRARVRGAIFHPLAEVVAGSPGAANVGSSADGRITLADQRGQNIALGLNATELGVTDGKIGTPVWSLPQGLGALNQAVDITLTNLTRINRVRVITKPPEGNETYRGNSLLGYSVLISEDKSRWIEMGGIHDIQDYASTEVEFNPVLARYVRVQVTQAEVGSDPAKVTEIQIYSVDFIPSGRYISNPIDFGSPGVPKNFGRVRWWAKVPPPATLTMQFSTGDVPDTTDASWSAWSEELAQSEVFVPSPEPRRYLRYRANLKTDDLEFTPSLDSLEIDYTTEGIAARDARGAVTPNEALMGADIPFLYKANLALAAGDSVEKIRIWVPSFPTAVDTVGLFDQQIPVAKFPTGKDGVTVSGHRLRIAPGGVDVLDVQFDPPLTSTDGTSIPFEILVHSVLYTDIHEFRAYLFSPGSDNPQNVREEVAGGVSWKVTATDALKKGLLDVGARPPVFTPNEDGTNDFTVVEFTLAKVAEPRRVDVEIFDLTGRRVRKLDVPPLTAGRYVHPLPGAEEAYFIPGYWDGRDGTGHLLPPGTYLFTVRVELDTGTETARGVVHIVY